MLKTITFVFCILLFLYPLHVKGQSMLEARNGTFQLSTMNSIINISQNGDYTFVLLSSRSIEKETKEVRHNWKIDKHSKETISELEKILLKNVEKEKSIRLKYKVSGLYKSNSDEPVFKVDRFYQEADKIYVSNDGTYIIGFNSFLFVQNMLNTKPENIINSQEPALFTLSSEVSNLNPCLLKIADLKLEKASIKITSDGYFWADKLAIFDNEQNSLEIKKGNGESIIFDAKTCTIDNNDADNFEKTSTNSDKQKSVCFSLSVILFLISKLLKSYEI